MSGDRNKRTWWPWAWRPPAWAVWTALAALAIIGGAAWLVHNDRVLDRKLPKAQLEALPGDGHVTLQWTSNKTANNGVEWQYEQRYAWRENEYNPPSRWKPMPEDRVVPGLANGSGYVFRVRAVRDGKHGLPSNEAVVTPTAVPGRLDNIADRLVPAIERGFENLMQVMDDQEVNPPLPAPADPSPSVTDDQWTALLERLTAIATHLKTIADRMPPQATDGNQGTSPPATVAPSGRSPGDATSTGRGPEPPRQRIARALTLVHFPNARLVGRVPVGDGVTVSEQAVNPMLDKLAACAEEGDSVTVRPYGFASNAPFRNADGTPMEESDALNLKTANLRARNAGAALTQGAGGHPHVRIEEPHDWSSLEQMEQKRDDESLITYSGDRQNRERLRRVVVLKVLARGRCTFE